MQAPIKVSSKILPEVEEKKEQAKETKLARRFCSRTFVLSDCLALSHARLACPPCSSNLPTCRFRHLSLLSHSHLPCPPVLSICSARLLGAPISLVCLAHFTRLAISLACHSWLLLSLILAACLARLPQLFVLPARSCSCLWLALVISPNLISPSVPLPLVFARADVYACSSRLPVS